MKNLIKFLLCIVCPPYLFLWRMTSFLRKNKELGQKNRVPKLENVKAAQRMSIYFFISVVLTSPLFINCFNPSADSDSFSISCSYLCILILLSLFSYFRVTYILEENKE